MAKEDYNKLVDLVADVKRDVRKIVDKFHADTGMCVEGSFSTTCLIKNALDVIYIPGDISVNIKINEIYKREVDND